MSAILIAFGYFVCWVANAACLNRWAPKYDPAFEDMYLCVMCGFLWPGVVFGLVLFGSFWIVAFLASHATPSAQRGNE